MRLKIRPTIRRTSEGIRRPNYSTCLWQFTKWQHMESTSWNLPLQAKTVMDKNVGPVNPTGDPVKAQGSQNVNEMPLNPTGDPIKVREAPNPTGDPIKVEYSHGVALSLASCSWSSAFSNGSEMLLNPNGDPVKVRESPNPTGDPVKV